MAFAASVLASQVRAAAPDTRRTGINLALSKWVLRALAAD
jgi:hypothetical protein